MNRRQYKDNVAAQSVPRRRGDEPKTITNWLKKERVPRRRGDEPVIDGGGFYLIRCSPQARG